MKVGIIGGGQLAQMLGQAATLLGIDTVCLEKTLDCPAQLSCEVIEGDYSDPQPLQTLADQCDVITYEFENVSVDALQKLSAVEIHPNLDALATSQDRLAEKTFASKTGIPTAAFQTISTLDDFKTAIDITGLPAILKTRRFGYDGKGQMVINSAAECDTAWQALQQQPCILEKKVQFERELSCLGVRNRAGEMRFYPLIENVHRDGILRISKAPYADKPLQQLAEQHVSNILQAFDYVGVIAVEFFQVGDKLYFNEFAPRVHNSGHWTIEGAHCSQFENHCRAIVDLPLGNTAAVSPAAMINFIGEVPDLRQLLSIDNLHVHLYHKSPRPGRKLGHATVLAADAEQLHQAVEGMARI